MNQLAIFWDRMPAFKQFRISIRNKLLLSFLAVLGLTVLVSLVALNSQNQAANTVTTLVEVEGQLAQLDLEILSALMEARQLEQSYVLQNPTIGTNAANIQYVVPWQEKINLVRQKLAEAGVIHEIAGDDISRAATEIDLGLNEYETTFLAMTNLVEQRGAGNSGLVGATRTSIEALESVVAEDEALMPLQLEVTRLRRLENEYFVRGDSQLTRQFSSGVTRLQTAIVGEDLAIPESQQTDILALLTAYQGNFNELVSLNNQIDRSTAVYTIAINGVQASFDSVLSNALANEQVARTELEVAQMAARRTIIIVTLVSIVLGILLALFLARRFTTQVNHLLTLFEHIRQGDYEARAVISSQDELGKVAYSLNGVLDDTVGLIQTRDEKESIQASIMQLLADVADVADGDLTAEAQVKHELTGAIADSFNYMLAQLRTIIRDVQDTTIQVSSAAHEVQTTADHLAEGNDLQAAQIIDTSAAIDEMSVSIQQVSENAVMSATVGEQAKAMAQQGNVAVQNTIAGMSRIREQVQETSKRIKRLGESSQEIGEIVQLINDIADRTSILALNASIQAAMAGEQGRGFAVVAEEVERLADRSAGATKRIAALIRTIQNETNEAVSAMEATTKEVVDGSQLANSAGSSLTEIEGVSSQLAELIQSISVASKQQARGSETIARSMNSIADVTQQSAAGTKQAAVSIGNLAQLADELRSSVSMFKIQTNGAVGD